MLNKNSLEMSTEFFSCIEQCAQPSWAEKSVIHKKVIVQGALALSKKKLILIQVSTLGQMGSVGVKLEVAWPSVSPLASAARVCFCNTHSSASPPLQQVSEHKKLLQLHIVHQDYETGKHAGS
ncbi:DNA repair-scaffolding protein [Manis javanica]|nr:DNA repair-scaffolding protein [Manis javanica]